MKRWIFSGLLVLSILVIGIGLISINSASWWEGMLKSNINTRLMNVHIREINIDRVSLNLMQGKLIIHELKSKLKVDDEAYFISAGDVVIEGLYRWFLHTSVFDIHVLHTAIVSDHINVSDFIFNGSLIFDNHILKTYSGELTISKVELNQMVMTAISGDVSGDINQVKVSRLICAFYEGVVTSDLLIGFSHDSMLSLNSHFDHVNLEPMASLNPSVIGQMKGIVEGQVQVTMQHGSVKAFRGRLLAPDGGLIKAEVLRYLAAYMPQKELIEKLIANNETIPLNKAQMESLSYNDQNFSSQIKLYSSQLNLDMNITLDVNIDGGLKTLLRGVL